jgi:hypothetical protein
MALLSKYGAASLAALLACLAIVTPVSAQTRPEDGNGNPTLFEGKKLLVVQLNAAMGTAGAKADQSGLSAAAQVVPQPSEVSIPGNGGSPGTLPVDRSQYPGGTRGNRYGGGVPPTYNPGDGGGEMTSGKPPTLGGPSSQNTIPCGTPEFVCFNTPGGRTFWGVPASSWGGFTSAVPAGPWIPTGAVTRLDPIAEARRLVSSMAWPNVTIGSNPNPGIVALGNGGDWFWVQGYNGQTLTNRGTISETHHECRVVSVPSPNPGDPPSSGLECQSVTNTLTVEVAAGPKSYEWNFGDGRKGSDVTYAGPTGLGRAYTDANTPSPVAWSYEFSSYGHPGGFTITCRITFGAEFRVNGGAWVALDPVTQTYSGSHVVRAVVPMVVADSIDK